MQSCRIRLSKTDQEIHLALTDFNRLRWVIAAIRTNPKLRSRLSTQARQPAYIADSTGFLGPDASAGLPANAHIVLWDGLNSLLELWQADAAIAAREDIRYLHVGYFPDVATAFPETSIPLFATLSETWEALKVNADTGIMVPLAVDLRSACRAALRPWKNRRENPELHDALRQGGHIVFCGLVRPTGAVLDNFFRGSSMTGLRSALAPLEAVEWRGRLTDVEQLIVSSYNKLTLTNPQTPSDWSCLYSVLGILHRIGTLAHLDSLSCKLRVNEYGLQRHLDPYDNHAYRRNLFADFGSTRGPDEVYPRMMDLLTNRKPCERLRFLASDASLRDLLQTLPASAFMQMCRDHAQLLNERLQSPEFNPGRK